MAYRIVDLPSTDLSLWLGPALTIYVRAMGYPIGTETHRAPLWREHAARAGWRAVGAVKPASDQRGADTLVGIAYGYRGTAGQWWNQQLRNGMRQCGYGRDRIDALLADYFELTELHVHPCAQGLGLGEQLMTQLLENRPEARVLLSTPEVPGEVNRAWRLYRRLGFADILRKFTFTGDPRPFAVLGRELPVPGDHITRNGR